MDRRLLKKFFDGKCSPEEDAQVMSWYFSGEADKVLSDEIEALWEDKETITDKTWYKEGSFKTIADNIPELKERQMGTPTQKSVLYVFKDRYLFLFRNCRHVIFDGQSDRVYFFIK